MENAEETLATAGDWLEKKRYRDCINRSYYAAFYAIKAVLALEEKDFKRHKDAVAYFNHHYVAEGIFSRELGNISAVWSEKEKRATMTIFMLHRMKKQ